MNSSNSATVVKRDGKARANTGPLFIIQESAGQQFLRDAFKQNDKDIEKWRREGVAQSRFDKLNEPIVKKDGVRILSDAQREFERLNGA